MIVWGRNRSSSHGVSQTCLPSGAACNNVRLVGTDPTGSTAHSRHRPTVAQTRSNDSSGFLPSLIPSPLVCVTLNFDICSSCIVLQSPAASHTRTGRGVVLVISTASQHPFETCPQLCPRLSASLALYRTGEYLHSTSLIPCSAPLPQPSPRLLSNEPLLRPQSSADGTAPLSPSSLQMPFGCLRTLYTTSHC